MPRYTQGEWRTEAVSDAMRVVVGEGRKKIILARLRPPRLPEAETAANAVLMAAAPRLLDALKIARECIAWCREHHKDVQSGEGIPVEAFIDAAIAEAEADGAYRLPEGCNAAR